MVSRIWSTATTWWWSVEVRLARNVSRETWTTAWAGRRGKKVRTAWAVVCRHRDRRRWWTSWLFTAVRVSVLRTAWTAWWSSSIAIAVAWTGWCRFGPSGWCSVIAIFIAISRRRFAASTRRRKVAEGFTWWRRILWPWLATR